MTILSLMKMGEISTKKIKNSVKKGEVQVIISNFFFSHGTCTADTNKQRLVWERVNVRIGLTLYHTILCLTLSQTSPGFYVSAVQVF